MLGILVFAIIIGIILLGRKYMCTPKNKKKETTEGFRSGAPPIRRVSRKKPRSKTRVENFSNRSQKVSTSFKSTEKQIHYAIEPYEVYDEFYCEVYNQLFYSEKMIGATVGWIYTKSLQDMDPKDVHILDCGCGTGTFLRTIRDLDYRIDGLDQSRYMIRRSKKFNPTLTCIEGNFEDPSIIREATYTHITCLFFSIYYSKNLNTVFANFARWLKPKGYLFIHVVKRNKFDTMLERASSSISMYDPIRHNQGQRVKRSVVKFKEFTYTSNWNFNGKSATFQEEFNFHDRPYRRYQEHHFVLWDINYIINSARRAGFSYLGKMDLMLISYDYNYILGFQREF